MDLAVYAIPAFIAFMVIESLVTRRLPVRGYERRDTAASLAMGVGNVLIDLAMKGVTFAALSAAWRLRIAELDTGAWWVWAAGLVVADFLYYWFHRLHHEVRFLWAAHVNHHSSEHYNLSTALRQSWTTPLTGLPFWLPMPLLGFSPALTLTLRSINTLYQFWIHTEAIGRLGVLEWFLNTPSHHRVHHGANVEYLDRNHGGMFIVWDRLFGTFEPERAPVRYGLTKNIHTFNPLRIAFHEWSAMLRDVARPNPWRVRLAYALAPPGWSPDGSTQTSAQMRAELRRREPEAAAPPLRRAA